MKTIHKFPVPIPEGGTHGVIIEMPYEAEILHVNTQGCYGDHAWLWALVETENKKAKYRFELYGTGHEVATHVDYAEGGITLKYRRLKYVGTFMLEDGHFVGHLFQVMNGFGGPELA